MAAASERSDPELVARDASLAVAMSNDLAEAVFAYLAMHGTDYGEAWDWLERLAERWREAAEEHKLEQLGDDFLPSDAQDLLASLESSLVLAASSDPDRRAMQIRDHELMQRLIAVASHGLWDDWDELIAPAWAELERQAGGPLERGPVDRPATPRPRRGRRAARARELVALLDDTMGQTAQLFAEIAPDGRELSAEERARTLAQLERAAAFTRTLDLEYDTISRDDHEFTRPSYALFRSTQRSLVLALADDPGRRARAMAIGEARVRAAMLPELLNGATWEEAWETVQAAMRERAKPTGSSST